VPQGEIKSHMAQNGEQEKLQVLEKKSKKKKDSSIFPLPHYSPACCTHKSCVQ
jgi:hypothetical protein